LKTLKFAALTTAVKECWNIGIMGWRPCEAWANKRLRRRPLAAFSLTTKGRAMGQWGQACYFVILLFYYLDSDAVGSDGIRWKRRLKPAGSTR